MKDSPIRLAPIGYVHSTRNDLQDDDWDSVTTERQGGRQGNEREKT